MAYRFSPTSLKLLSECPRCFWLHFRKNVKRPAGIFPSLPSGMDGIFKQHFDRYMEIDLLPPELDGIEGGVCLFKDKEKLETWRNNFKGIGWRDSNGNIIRGAVDNLLEKGGKFIILDYKTRGYPLKDDTAGFYQDQLDIYNFLFRKNGYETEDYSYLLFYHPEKVNGSGEVIFNTDLVKVEVDISNAETIIRKALLLLEEEQPDSSDECEYCKWATRAGEEKLSPRLLH